MAQRIGSRLKESGQLRDYRVGIKFVDGVACLTGTVTSPDQAEAAVRLTRQVEGVTHVVNDLTVTASRTDQAVKSVPANVVIVSRETMRLSAAKSIPDLLRVLPGFGTRDFQSLLAPYGLTDASVKNVPVTVPLSFTVGNANNYYGTEQSLTYKATAGKSGTAKN